MQLALVELHVAPPERDELAAPHPGAGEDRRGVADLGITSLRLGQDIPDLGCRRCERLGPRRPRPSRILRRVRVDEAALASEIERPGEHGGAASHARRALPGGTHSAVEVLDVLPRESAEPNRAELATIGQMDRGHDLRRRADSGDRARCQLDEAGVDRLAVELEHGGDRAGVGATGGQALLVVGDLQAGEGELGFLTGAVDRAGHPPAVAADGITRYLDINAPHAVPHREHPATAASARSLGRSLCHRGGASPRAETAFAMAHPQVERPNNDADGRAFE